MTVASAIFNIVTCSDMRADHNDKRIQRYVRGQTADHAKHNNQRTF